MSLESLIDAVFISSFNLGKTCIQVYDAATGSCIKSFRGLCVSSNSLTFVGSSEYLLCGQKDKPLLQAWAFNQNDSLPLRFPLPGNVTVMAVSQSSTKLCALGIGEKIYIYDLNTGLQFGLIARHYQDVKCLEFTPCGNYLASAGEDGFVYLWSKFSLIESLHKSDKPQILPHFVLGQHSDRVTSLRISRAGMRGILITTSLDHSAKIFDLVTGRLRHNVIAGSALTSCEVNALGSQVFLSGGNGRVWGVNLLPQNSSQDLQGKGTLCHEGKILHMALTITGDTLVTGCTNGEVKVWSVVMSEKKSVFNNPSLALQNTLIVGKGAITNLRIQRIDSEVFDTSSIDFRAVLTPFSIKDSSTSVRDEFVTYVPQKRKIQNEHFHILDHVPLILKEKSIFSNSGNAKSKKKDGAVYEPQLSETELLAQVKKLKRSNEELYKFCLKHVLGEDDGPE